MILEIHGLAHIRTGQKYEWVVQFCLFFICFCRARSISAVQNFLMQNNVFWPVLICAPSNKVQIVYRLRPLIAGFSFSKQRVTGVLGHRLYYKNIEWYK